MSNVRCIQYLYGQSWHAIIPMWVHKQSLSSLSKCQSNQSSGVKGRGVHVQIKQSSVPPGTESTVGGGGVTQGCEKKKKSRPSVPTCLCSRSLQQGHLCERDTAVPGASNRLYKSTRASKHFLERPKPDLAGVDGESAD